MKKEIVIAIIIGLTLGLVITYGLYVARTSLTKTPTNQLNPSGTPVPSPTDALSTLALNSPLDESVQAQKEVTIAGTTLPESLVVIFVNNEETITTADKVGQFSIATDLEAGSNIIIVEAIDEDGTSTKLERTVIYDAAVLSVSGSSGDEATRSATKSPSPSPKVSPKASIKP